MNKLVATAFLIGMATSTTVWGADLVQLEPEVTLPPPPPLRGTIESFGYIYVAATAFSFPALSSSVQEAATLGGKFAYDPIDHSLGFQLDGNADYAVSGQNLSYAQATGHITKAISDETKIGAFAAIDKSSRAAVGFEVLTTLSDRTWAQTQTALLDATQTGTLAIGVGASIHHRLGDNWNLRGDLNYVNFSSLGVSSYGGDAALQYTLETIPVSLGVSAGYNYVTAAGLGVGEYLASAKVQYSFGGPSDGVRGKLFRTNALGLTP